MHSKALTLARPPAIPLAVPCYIAPTQRVYISKLKFLVGTKEWDSFRAIRWCLLSFHSICGHCGDWGNFTDAPNTAFGMTRMALIPQTDRATRRFSQNLVNSTDKSATNRMELECYSWPTCSKQPRLVDCRIGVVNKLDRRVLLTTRSTCRGDVWDKVRERSALSSGDTRISLRHSVR